MPLEELKRSPDSLAAVRGWPLGKERRWEERERGRRRKRNTGEERQRGGRGKGRKKILVSAPVLT